METRAGSDVRELIMLVLRHPLGLLIGGLAGMLSFLFLFGVFFPPTYTAEVQIRISASLPSRANTTTRLNLEDINAAKARAATCAEVLKGPSLYQSIIHENNLSYTVDQLQKKVKVDRKADTEIVSLKITSKSSQEAKALAEQFSLAAPSFLTFSVRTGSASTVSSNIIPLEDERLPLWALAVLGIPFGGGAFSVLLIAAKMLLDLVVCRDDLVTQYDIPILGEIPSRLLDRQQYVSSCSQVLLHLSEREGQSMIRLAGLVKPEIFESLAYALAEAIAKNSSVLLIGPQCQPAVAEETPESLVYEHKPGFFRCELPENGNAAELLSSLQAKHPCLLISDSFSRGAPRAIPLQPAEQIVMIVKRDYTAHVQIRRCLEAIRLYRVPVLGFIFIA